MAVCEACGGIEIPDEQLEQHKKDAHSEADAAPEDDASEDAGSEEEKTE